MAHYPSLDQERLIKAIKSCLNPKHPLYVKGNVILVHREDVLRDGWILLKLGLIIYNLNPNFNWILRLYDSEDEFRWNVILWEETLKKSN